MVLQIALLHVRLRHERHESGVRSVMISVVCAAISFALSIATTAPRETKAVAM